jgi:hypothetical protein
MVAVCQSGLKEWSQRNFPRANSYSDISDAAGLREDADWRLLEDAILRALAPFPEAEAAVIRELERLEPAVENSA